MNAVERLVYYSTSLPQEGSAHIESDPAEGVWPSRGRIILRDIDAAYHSRPDKLVLRNVNLTFNAGETVLIVGRTGSGKSTLLSLLLRMIESSNGTVEIDGRGQDDLPFRASFTVLNLFSPLDIKSVSMSTLRRGMQVIPQGKQGNLGCTSMCTLNLPYRSIHFLGHNPLLSRFRRQAWGRCTLARPRPCRSEEICFLPKVQA